MSTTKTKLALGGFIICLGLFAGTGVVRAADENQLPSRWTYSKEWISLHLLTWRHENKVSLMNELATKRTEEIKVADASGQQDRVEKLAQRYEYLEGSMSSRLESDNTEDDLIDTSEQNVIERQAVLSQVRQETQSSATKETIAQVQERAVNRMREALATSQDEETVDNFVDRVVTVWRDPKGMTVKIDVDKESRVYAPGDKITDNDGVIIDQGEGKISQNKQGNLKIEYAPGTGPNSVTTGGKRVWKIQMSDGSVIDSYKAGGMVVVGDSKTTTSNVVIVNTTDGGTTNSANTVNQNTVDGGVGGNAEGSVEVNGTAGEGAQQSGGGQQNSNSNSNKAGNNIAP